MPQTRNVSVQDDDGSIITIPVDASISNTDPRLPGILDGALRAKQRAKATFDANAPKPTALDKIMALGGKAVDAVKPYLPTMQQVPAIAGGALASGTMGPEAAPLGALGGEGIRQIISQLSSGTPQSLPEAASNDTQAAVPSALEGMGAQLMSKLAATKASQLAAGGPVKWIEQRLLGNGASAEKKAIVARLAPEMAQDPTFTRAFSQNQFDQGILTHMDTAKRLLDSAEAAVPPGTTATKAPLLTAVDQLMDEFRVPGGNVQQQVPVNTPGRGITGFQPQNVQQSVSVNKDALAALQELKDELNKFPDHIPWEDLQTFRQKLDKNIFLKGGFKETATAADRAKIVAEREVANATRAHLADSLPAGPVRDNMTAANQAYSKAADMGLASGMDFDVRRRLSDVGSKTAVQKIAPWIGAGALGEEVLRRGYNRLSGQ